MKGLRGDFAAKLTAEYPKGDVPPNKPHKAHAVCFLRLIPRGEAAFVTSGHGVTWKFRGAPGH